MNTIHRRGSALVLVLIASMFLIILTAGAFRYFQTNASTQIWAKERIQAKLSAEAGVNLATHMLVAGASLPTDLEAQDILGTNISFFDLPPGMGSVYATVDPNNYNKIQIMANAFMIRCIANVSGSTIETFGIQAIIMPENLARFSVFMDNPSVAGAYTDGYRFDGPFYANGPVRIVSGSATHENDVFFYSFELTSDYYIYGWGGGVQATTPAEGKLEMRPYNRLILGAPYFDLGVDPIPFGSAELDWQGVKNAALADGLYLDINQVPDGSRLALKGDTLFVKIDTLTPSVAYPLGGLGNPVVWIENGADNWFLLRGHQSQGLDMALTIGTMGDVYMSGRLSYENDDPQDPDNENLLGIMTVNGDLIIADDPDADEPGWVSERFTIDTDHSFSYYAVLLALDGDILAENNQEPEPTCEFQIVGGYMVQSEGYTSSSKGGFNMGVYFDPRLLYMHPPFFPTTANWNTTMWAEKPHMTVNEVHLGLDPLY